MIAGEPSAILRMFGGRSPLALNLWIEKSGLNPSVCCTTRHHAGNEWYFRYRA